MSKTAALEFPSRIGVWWNSEPWPIRDAQGIARDIEAMGFGSLFMPEGLGPYRTIGTPGCDRVSTNPT